MIDGNLFRHFKEIAIDNGWNNLNDTWIYDEKIKSYFVIVGDSDRLWIYLGTNDKKYTGNGIKFDGDLVMDLVGGLDVYNRNHYDRIFHIEDPITRIRHNYAGEKGDLFYHFIRRTITDNSIFFDF